MFTITKEFPFEAAHHLPAMPDGHQCKRPHGHSYVITVELQAERLDQYGFVLDYGELKFIKEFVDSKLDHRDLTDIFGNAGNTTTAELMARELYTVWRDKLLGPVVEVNGESIRVSMLTAVTVSETRKTSATYRASLAERTRPLRDLVKAGTVSGLTLPTSGDRIIPYVGEDGPTHFERTGTYKVKVDALSWPLLLTTYDTGVDFEAVRTWLNQTWGGSGLVLHSTR